MGKRVPYFSANSLCQQAVCLLMCSESCFVLTLAGLVFDQEHVDVSDKPVV